MRTAIIYATSHGTTGKVANIIKERLSANNTKEESINIFNLKQNSNIDLSVYDTIVLGGSIHAGNIQGSVKEFCKNNLVDLLQKRVALFICAMNKPEYETELKNSFPELLFNHAISKEVVGGEFLFDKMNFIEKMLVRNISGIKETTSKIDDSKIEALCRSLHPSVFFTNSTKTDS
ncbi:hypothetical protein MASR2M69_15900 [Bacteroidota bacterium]